MNLDERKNKDYHEAIKNVVQHLKCKRSALQNEITCDEIEKSRVVGEMNKLQDKLCILDANIKKKAEFRKEYDKAISQSEGHFVELMEKSEHFLNMTKRQALALSQTVCGEPKVCENSQRNPIIKCDPGPSLPECPTAVLAIQRPELNGINCANASPCTTIMIPCRANGL